MPKCRKCGSPIVFLSEQPRPTIVGGFTGHGREVWSDPRPLPIDVDPSPDGKVAIYEVPSPTSPFPEHGRDWKGPRQRFIAILSGEALKSFRQYAGVTYRIHFDTCRNR